MNHIVSKNDDWTEEDKYYAWSMYVAQVQGEGYLSYPEWCNIWWKD